MQIKFPFSVKGRFPGSIPPDIVPIQARGIEPDVTVSDAGGPRSVPVVREADLEGHLAAEGTTPDAGAQPERATPWRRRDVPARPTDEDDRALATAWRMLGGAR